MIIYLDNCAYNRPFDDQEKIKIKIETEAKLYIQEKIEKGAIKLVWSYILDFENSVNPFEERKDQIFKWKKYADTDISENTSVLQRAEEYKGLGIAAKDALHISCAVEGKCEYFITTDNYLIKKAGEIDKIKVVTPTAFIEMEEKV